MLQKRKITLGLEMGGNKVGIVLIAFTLLLSGCKKNDCSSIGGVWSIAEMKVNGKNFKPYLYINTLGFHCENRAAWFHASYFFENDQHASWEILSEERGVPNLIKINSSIKIYNDVFEIQIQKSDAGQFHVVLKSKEVYISAFKIIDDYDS